MKRRSDFVTNSSSSSYTIALYKEEPKEDRTYCYEDMAINTCDLSTIYDLWDYFSPSVMSKLSLEMYQNGINDNNRLKFYQFIFWELFSKKYTYSSGENSDEEIIENGFNQIECYLEAGYSLISDNKVEYPMIPDKSYKNQFDYKFFEYFEIYNRQEMLDYLNSIEKTYETIVKWFENLTGCTWLISCNWENDDPPAGAVMLTKIN